MILCLDIGNSHIFGGVFTGDELELQFRRTSQLRSSSDELGVFFRAVLRENDIDPESIDQVAICCVVPDLLYSLRATCQKYFDIDPLMWQKTHQTRHGVLAPSKTRRLTTCKT